MYTEIYIVETDHEFIAAYESREAALAWMRKWREGFINLGLKTSKIDQAMYSYMSFETTDRKGNISMHRAYRYIIKGTLK